MALSELGDVLPASRKVSLLHSLVIKERFATYSPSPEAEPLRPHTRTPIRGLFLAGDWTATGLPATIEGAVRSGYTAARELLQGTGNRGQGTGDRVRLQVQGSRFQVSGTAVRGPLSGVRSNLPRTNAVKRT